MAVAIVLARFALILACLVLLVQHEYRRLVHGREAHWFDRLMDSSF
ncbi:MAG: hypothetical protein LAP40_08325 [Acidobacteriia bacterium]|nr:hypothetical protein [Terriglobia bacterium]